MLIAIRPNASQRLGKIARLQKANTQAKTMIAGRACQPTIVEGTARITIRSIRRVVDLPSGSSFGSAAGQKPLAKYLPKAVAATIAVITRRTASTYLPCGCQSSLTSICQVTTMRVGNAKTGSEMMARANVCRFAGSRLPSKRISPTAQHTARPTA